jgi:hypothetical protein
MQVSDTDFNHEINELQNPQINLQNFHWLVLKEEELEFAFLPLTRKWI